MYYIPTKLLTTQSYKTMKGMKKGITTYISYIAPYTQNTKGINLCSHASVGCAKACLFNSGNARYNSIQVGRINKANYFIENRKVFMSQLYAEILSIVKKHKNLDADAKYNKKGEVSYYKKFAIRLNGTTDIPFEKFKFEDGKNIFEKFPDVQFYDYTKNLMRLKRVKDMKLKNVHLTFSRSETNDADCKKAIEMGYNVAVIFSKLPKQYMGLNVINGDETDLRFQDKKNVIVGLLYKRASVQGGTQINQDAHSNGFIINVA